MTAAAPPPAVDDWTRVDAGTFHDFHQTWLSEIKLGLNRGGLPEGYYAQSERKFGAVSATENEADVLALEVPAADEWGDSARDGGGTALLEAPPAAAVETDLSAKSDVRYYAAKQSRLAIKRGIDHRIVALIEIASPGNKDRRVSVERFTRKAVEAMEDGVHLVLIDLLPPGPADPAGLHGAVLDQLGATYAPPAGKPLVAASYRCGMNWRAFAEPLAVGDPPPTVPLFLTPRHHVPLPLGPSYATARGGMGFFWDAVLKGERERPRRPE